MTGPECEGFSAGGVGDDEEADVDEEDGGGAEDDAEDLESFDASLDSSAGTSIFEISSPSSASIAIIFPTGTFLEPSWS